MSSGPARPGQHTKPNPAPSSFMNVHPSAQAILLDKLNIRVTTPDSEALASSDDEGESHRQESQPTFQKSVRRPSWLNDSSPAGLNHPRKRSFAANPMSPSISHSTTPSGEAGSVSTSGPWGPTPTSAVGRQSSSTTSAPFSWGQGIWSSDRREPPARLSEVLPSPTSIMSPSTITGPSFFTATDTGLGQTSLNPRDTVTGGTIPFPIPLHPTPKTYRSQSYSVGQLEPDSPANTTTLSSSLMLGRLRAHGHGVLQHRPSRPSMLSEMSSDGGLLGKLREVDDDDNESATESLPGSHFLTSEAKTIEILSRENAMLRQQQFQNSRIRPRSSTQASFSLGNCFALRHTVPEESEYAVDELDESNDADSFAKRALQRRLSEFAATGSFRPSYAVENRKLEILRKAAWQSTSPYCNLSPDLPQSRRHSFADVPVRQGSISSLADSVSVLDLGGNMEPHPQQDIPAGYTDMPSFPPGHPASYFNVGANVLGPQNSTFAGPFSSTFGIPPPFPQRPSSPHRNTFGMTQPRQNQLLQIVLFKCARADVFYIQEGVGLTVKIGDLVIVEADRGTDLGTVARADVDWQSAKEFKEYYAEEHYKWLMMYSQNASASHEFGTSAVQTPLGGAIGGVGLHTQGQPQQQQHMQEPTTGELKPKLIKRLAQPHEVQSLRDKEGNEARAKRICMQKVKEHGLNMEILDAEYQMDWKKLTFYYFAETYINFNSLVTDLFKIYKTRIWMSAINPASFASPTLGVQAPSGVGIGAIGIGRGVAGTDGRQSQSHQQQTQHQEKAQATHLAEGPISRGFQPQAYTQAFSVDRANTQRIAFTPTSFPASQFGTLRALGRPLMFPYVPSITLQADASNPDFFTATSGRFQQPAPSITRVPAHVAPLSTMAASASWVGAFQGLPLNSQ